MKLSTSPLIPDHPLRPKSVKQPSPVLRNFSAVQQRFLILVPLEARKLNANKHLEWGGEIHLAMDIVFQ